jgi:hypothetical protein
MSKFPTTCTMALMFFEHKFLYGRQNIHPYSYDLRWPFTMDARSPLLREKMSANGKPACSCTRVKNFNWFCMKKKQETIWVLVKDVLTCCQEIMHIIWQKCNYFFFKWVMYGHLIFVYLQAILDCYIFFYIS